MPTGVPAAATGRTGVLPETPGSANAEALVPGMPATARARAISRSASEFALPARPRALRKAWSPTSSGRCHAPHSPCSARHRRSTRYFVPAGAGFLKIFGPMEPGTAATQVSSVRGGAVLDDRVAVRTGRRDDEGLGALAAVRLQEVNARDSLRARALLAAADTDRQRRQRHCPSPDPAPGSSRSRARVDRGDVLLGDAGGRRAPECTSTPKVCEKPIDFGSASSTPGAGSAPSAPADPVLATMHGGFEIGNAEVGRRVHDVARATVGGERITRHRAITEGRRSRERAGAIDHEALDRDVLRDRARAPARATFGAVVHRRRWCCAEQPEPAPRSTACSCRRGSPGSPSADARYRLIVPAWHSSWNSAWKLSRAAEAPATTSCVGAAAVSAWLRAKAPDEDISAALTAAQILRFFIYLLQNVVARFRRAVAAALLRRPTPASVTRPLSSIHAAAGSGTAGGAIAARVPSAVQDHVEALVGARERRSCATSRWSARTGARPCRGRWQCSGRRRPSHP